MADRLVTFPRVDFRVVGAPEPPPPDPPPPDPPPVSGTSAKGEFGRARPIPDDQHPRLIYNQDEVTALRSLVNGGTIPLLNSAWNVVRNKNAILMGANWPSAYPESARHGRTFNYHNQEAALSYAIEPTTAKANAIRSALNDMKNRFPNGRRGDLNFGTWHFSAAMMFDFIQAYHPGHFTSAERAAMKEWFRRCANVTNSVRVHMDRNHLLSFGEYNSSNYDRTDAGKRVTFYTNWFIRAVSSTGAAALVSGDQTQVDTYFDSGWPHAVLHKGQITSTFPPTNLGLNRFDLIMYILSFHPHGECTDTWGREHYRHPQNDFNTSVYGRYHPSTWSNAMMAAEMAYRNGMTGVFGIKDSFVTLPYLRLGAEFMFDHRNAINRGAGGEPLRAFRFSLCNLAWSRYDTTKINLSMSNLIDTEDGGEFTNPFLDIYKYPRRVV
jgi:hypothetical protein